MKVFVSNEDVYVARMFQDHGMKVTMNPSDSFDMLCLTGGMDIGPWLYGQRSISGTKSNFVRDLEEIKVWKSVPPKFPKVGICRGAQLGNVMCGGTLWQDVDGHDDYDIHDVVVHWGEDGRLEEVNTLHHQMCILTEEAKKLATADRSKYRRSETSYQTKNDFGAWTDVEAFFYPNFNFYGVQWHPEYTHKGSTELFFEMLEGLYADVINST